MKNGDNINNKEAALVILLNHFQQMDKRLQWLDDLLMELWIRNKRTNLDDNEK
jgi:hypothetical protein